MNKKKILIYIEISIILIISFLIIIIVFDLATDDNIIYCWSLLPTIGVTIVGTSLIYLVIKLNNPIIITVGEFENFDLLDVNGWEGQAIRFDWSFLIRIFEEKEGIEPIRISEEIKKRILNVNKRRLDGVYLISGNLENKKIMIYIGKTDNLKRRIGEHKKRFKWAKNIFFFSSVKNPLGDNFLLKLEEQLILSAKENNKLLLQNLISKSNRNLNYAEDYNLKDFLKKIKSILKKYNIRL